MNIQRLASVNNPSLIARGITAGGSLTPAATAGIADFFGGRAVSSSALTPSLADDAMRIMRAGVAPGASAAEVAAARGVGGNILASSMGGVFTQRAAGYFRGAQGMLGQAGLHGTAYGGARKAVMDLKTALNQTNVLGRQVNMATAKQMAQKSIFKQVGTKGVAKMAATKAGAKFLGARAAAFAIPGLQVVAAASLIYDLGKMGGEIVKSGIDLARDANRSMQGSMGKPLFGMGYRDTESAATSRARGVMAIQNSRLNARSALGSEASMMAAHFG
jgi:hypothetical protein